MKIQVLNSRGERQWIPSHWVDHPILGKEFTTLKGETLTPVPEKTTGKGKTKTNLKEKNNA